MYKVFGFVFQYFQKLSTYMYVGYKQNKKCIANMLNKYSMFQPHQDNALVH